MNMDNSWNAMNDSWGPSSDAAAGNPVIIADSTDLGRNGEQRAGDRCVRSRGSSVDSSVEVPLHDAGASEQVDSESHDDNETNEGSLQPRGALSRLTRSVSGSVAQRTDSHGKSRAPSSGNRHSAGSNRFTANSGSSRLDHRNRQEHTYYRRRASLSMLETASRSAEKGADGFAIMASTPALCVSGSNRSMGNHSSQKQPAIKNKAVPFLLLSLPIDTFHSIASFLTPADWSAMAQTSRSASRSCREIYRRVRMHGFRCAKEVADAWARGQHGDARELAALYIRSGVPIYPVSLGHSYNTLIWRMGIEGRELENATSATSQDNERRSDGSHANSTAVDDPDDADVEDADVDDNDGLHADSSLEDDPALDGLTLHRRLPKRRKKRALPLDRFFMDRYEARAQDGYYRSDLTYLDEKILFWQHRSSGQDDDEDFNVHTAPLTAERRRSLTGEVVLRPGPPRPAPGALPGNQQPLVGPIVPPHHNHPNPLDDPLAALGAMADDPFANLAAGLAGPPNQHHLPDAAQLARDDAAPGDVLRDANGQPRPLPPRVLRPRRAQSMTNLSVSTASSGGFLAASFRSVKKPTVRVHQHLLDQHLRGIPAVNDGQGSMKTAQISLSADFYHPQSISTVQPERSEIRPLDAFDPLHQLNAVSSSAIGQTDTGVSSVSGLMQANNESPFGVTGESDFLGGSGDGVDSSDTHKALLSEVKLEVYSALRPPGKKSSDGNESSSDAAVADQIRRLRPRFAIFQARLDNLLSSYDCNAFDECLLDFWDEILTYTAGVHFHDRHTAVPRMSNLAEFLTKPCPKAVGIVQCEIERIRLTPRNKGVNVKGRLFPVYEYRLFIRDRRFNNGENPISGSGNPVRCDTVMMMAKHRGKNAQQTAAAEAAMGAVNPTPPAAKRGVNNYYLYMPQVMDLDSHYVAVNSGEGGDSAVHHKIPQWMRRNASCPPTVLGRLQSNFIGTEFQIFCPRMMKPSVARLLASGSGGGVSDSEGTELSVKSRSQPRRPTMGATVPSPQSGGLSRSWFGLSFRNRLGSPRRGSLGRRNSTDGFLDADDIAAVAGTPGTSTVDSDAGGVSGHSDHDGDHSSVGSANTGHHSASKAPRRGLRRTGSLGALYGSRASRRSRRVIASDNGDGQTAASGTTNASSGVAIPVIGEEETGAITYTANLLGNRPRIMDVCVPRVGGNGVVDPKWRTHSDRCRFEGEPESMLTRFKHIQQRLDNSENPAPANNDDGHQNNNHRGRGGGRGNGNDNDDGDETVRGGSVGAAGVGSAGAPDYGLLALQNRPPLWNVELGAFVLNFGGRVSVASVKNFQLCDRQDQDHIMLQFGRIQGRHSFTMDFQYPLSAVQAFAIAISSLQSKISFG